MECKSIQSISSSSSRRSYDVFVSFRGEDTRNNFTDHLFHAFQRKGIVAFRDDRNLEQGEHISTKLVQAIEGSRVLVVVFSKNYANSSWCLQELAKIVDCMKVTGQSVLPVFYDVSPSEVRKQSGDYRKAFAEHEERFKQDLGMVQRWREALEQAASLSGWDVHNKSQSAEIEKIVERVKNILCYKLPSLDGLVGIYSRVEQLEKLLAFKSNHDVRVVGICGMGGIGKTTLARAVYDRNFHQYDASCFIDDISKVCHNDGPIAAQKQLICQTLKENQEICSITQANYLLRTRLRNLKSLIVLDNVDKVQQLEKLSLDRDSLCAGSRVIVISRDRHILDNYEVDAIYDGELLNRYEAHELFCRKAFKHNNSMSCDDNREYEWLTYEAIEYAQRLPLAIEVLGSFLCGLKISEWRSALARLKQNPNKDIMDVLQTSFDGLELEDQEIFLDIACFFNDKSERYVKKALDSCRFHSDIGIRILINKSLITISNSTVKMHQMLQELGRKIVQQNAPNEPWKWNRIWCWEDFDHLKSEKMAMVNLKAIRLKFRLYEDQKRTLLKAEVLSRMTQLRLLIIDIPVFYAKIPFIALDGALTTFSEDLSYFSSELGFLHWDAYPFTYFPASCETSKLVVLDLPYSNIKQPWEGIKALDNLKIMNLHHSTSLVNIPDLSLAPNLERLSLKGCTKLVQIHPSIGLLAKLAYLNLKNCTSLQSLPHTISDVSSLKTVNLQGCSKLFQSTSDAAIQCQSTCSAFKRPKLMLPLHLFHKSRELDLSYCDLVNIPEAMASLYWLEVLYLAGNNFVKLPCIIKELPKLISLNLDHCRQLTSLSDEFPLRGGLPAPEELVYWKTKKARRGLHIFDCPKLVGMEGWSSIALSWMIQCLKVHKETSPAITIVIPGTQIPSWFSYQRVGDKMAIKLFPNVHDCNWIGSVMCVEFVTYEYPWGPGRNSIMRLRFGLYVGDRCLRVATGARTTYGVTFKPSPVHHLCLFYLTRQQLIDIIEATEAHHPDPLEFFPCIDRRTLKSKGYGYPDVKHWGIRNVFNQDLEEHNGDE